MRCGRKSGGGARDGNGGAGGSVVERVHWNFAFVVGHVFHDDLYLLGYP
jgi:hypothetical protein